MREIEGSLDGTGLAVAIAASRFNAETTEGLLAGALSELAALGVAEQDVVVARVPGALELPLAAARLAGGGHCDAVIVLGAVIRGETDHYDFVCAQTTRGCGEVALATGVPVLFGVLTCDTLAQAAERSRPGAGNKGAEAARAAVEMARLLERLEAGVEVHP